MNNAKKTFISGLNHDASFFAHTKEDNLDALNARVISSSDGKSGSLSNIDGNRKINNLLNNKGSSVVGSLEDALTNDIYYFVANAAGQSKIFVYKNSSSSILLVLQDSDLESGVTLGFDKDKPVTGISFIDGLLYWTGATGKEPCRINVDRGIKLHNNSYSTDESAYVTPIPNSVITLIRKPPMLPPVVVAEVDTNRDTSFLKSQAYTFAFRYKYKDGETSVFSPTSRYYPHQDMDHSQHKLTRRMNVAFPNEKVEQDVDTIQLGVKVDNDTSYFIVHDFDDASSIDTHNASPATGSLSFNFYNDTLGNPVSDSDSVKLYDTIPHEAESLTIARNRLFLGNYKTGLENTTTKINTALFQLNIVTSSVPLPGTITEEQRFDGGVYGFSSASAYQVGMVFYDFAGRTAGVITSDAHTVITPERQLNITTYNEKINWILNSSAKSLIPTWATHYSIVRTKNLTKDFTLSNLINKIRYYKFDSNKSFSINLEKVDDNGDPTGKFEDQEFTSFSGEYEGIAIGLGDLTTYRLGYSYQAGDRIKIISKDEVFDFAITGTSGRYVLINLVNLNEKLGSTSLITQDKILVYEIYSPHKKTTNEFFYETDNFFKITDPGTSDAGYSETSGFIKGDIYLKNRKSDTSDEDTYTKEHTDDNSNSHEKPIIGKVDYIEFPIFYGTGLNDLSVSDHTTFSNANDKRFEIYIDGTGSPDTFKWRSYIGTIPGGTYTTGVAITGNAQTLGDGVSITFGATTGHTVGDKWCVSAKSLNASTTDQNLADLGRSAFAIFEGPPNDFIPAGSIVKFTLKETGKVRTTTEVTYDETEITQNYANLEEMITNVDPGFQKWGFHGSQNPIENVFRRGFVNPTDNGGKSQLKVLGNAENSQSITIPSLTDGSKINLIVPSMGRQGGAELDARSFIRSASISVNYPDEYEYNAEVMNPSDDYFLNWTQITGRPNIVVDDAKQINKVTSISFSETKIPGSNINGLSKFSALDETELDEITGPLRKLVLTTKTQSTGTVLLGLSENETTSIYLGEQQIEGSSSGSQFLAVTKGVIGTKNTLKGSYGCINPESVATNEGNAFWFDAKNSTVLRYSTEGVSSIGDVNMRSFFKKKGPLALSGSKVFGVYDNYNDEYILTVPQSGQIQITLQQDATYGENAAQVFNNPASNLVNGPVNVTIPSPWNITQVVTFTNGVGNLSFTNPYRFKFPSTIVTSPSGTNISVVNNGFSTTTEAGVVYHNTGSGALTISNVQNDVSNITVSLTRNDGVLTGNVGVKNNLKYYVFDGSSSFDDLDTPLRVTGATQTTSETEQKNSFSVSGGSVTIPCSSSVPWKFGSVIENGGPSGCFYIDQNVSPSVNTQIPSAKITSNASAIGSLGFGAGNFNVVVTDVPNVTDFIKLNSRPLEFASVTTNSATSITTTAFTMNGNFTDAGDGTVSAKGFVYSSSANVPEIGGSSVTNVTVSGTSTGTFNSTVTGQNSSTVFYFRAYVTTNVGTEYGAVESLTTLNASANAPTVTSSAATSVTSSGATLNGSITANGGASITEQGFVYSVTSTNNNPVINGTGVTKVTVPGTVSTLPHALSKAITNQSASTQITFKAYATNSAGTGYGAATTYTTSAQPATLGSIVNYSGSVSPNGGNVSLRFNKSGTGTLSGTATIRMSDGIESLSDNDQTFNINITSGVAQYVNFVVPEYNAPVAPARTLTFSMISTNLTLASGSVPFNVTGSTTQNGNGNIQ